MRKALRRNESTAWTTLVVSLVIVGSCVLALLTGCGPRPDHGTDPCQPACTVPVSTPAAVPADLGPVALPLCQVMEYGPCVGMWTDGSWRYVHAGYGWPDGETIDLCPTEDGGPWPCAWVPSAQHNGEGRPGALLYLYGRDA